MPLHRSDHDLGWVRRKFTLLDRQIRELSAARRLEAATIGAGGLHVKRGGDIFLHSEDDSVIWQASEDPIKTRATWNSAASGGSIPTTWTPLGYAQIAAIPGYVGPGHFLMNVSVGDTMSTGVGSVSCQPLFRWRFTDNTTTPWSGVGATAVASPENRIAVANSFWAASFSMKDLVGYETKTVSHVEFGVNGVRSFGTETGSDGNWSVAASVMFKRGGARS